MDADRFDSLTRSLTASLPRRGALHALARATLAGSLALLGLIEAEAKRKRRKRKNKKKKRRPATPQCSPACGACQTCQGGQCETSADGTPCGGGMICVGGECVTGQGTCETGADSCAEFALCTGQETDDDCQCQISIEGDTRCADSFGLDGSVCGQCTSSDQCPGLYPEIPGVFCMKGDCCTGVVGGACAQPCPPAASCETPEDCPDALNECQIRTCEDGKCDRTFVAEGTVLPPQSQVEGDCHRLVCDGNGNIRSEVDNTDTDCCMDCKVGTCDNGAPVYVPCCVGELCGNGGTCDREGNCVPQP